MNLLRLLPVFLSYLLLAAHFYRADQQVLVGLALAMPLLLFLRKGWVPVVVSTGLALGAIEWLLTLVAIARVRMEIGLPWERMAWILGAVAAFTLCSGLVFLSRGLRERYRAAPGQSG